MGRRIDEKTIDAIVELFKVDKNDADIAGEFNVSVSYVNKLRNSYKNAIAGTDEKQKIEEKFEVVDDPSYMDEIEVIQLKINSLKQTIKWYEELLEFKKK